MDNPALLASVSFFGILFVIAIVVIILAFFDTKRDRWTFLGYGSYLILIAIFSIVGIELLEALHQQKEFLEKLTDDNKRQLKEFVQVITTYKWAFTLVCGGIGVNITSHAILNEQENPLENVAHQKLDEISRKITFSNRLLWVALGLIMIGLGYISWKI
ncbi:hypothetical protein AAG584_10570 [Vreelandella titanicae]|uniref:hypothetical protein n=1 Tax=Vreelandella titanicae TaxID=664683 RepID=UPI0031599739